MRVLIIILAIISFIVFFVYYIINYHINNTKIYNSDRSSNIYTNDDIQSPINNTNNTSANNSINNSKDTLDNIINNIYPDTYSLYRHRVLLPNGTPTKHAKVYKIVISNEIRNNFLQSDNHFEYPLLLEETFTNENGEFFFNYNSNETYLLHAELNGYSSSHCTFIRNGNEYSNIDLTLGYGKKISGQVIDMIGNPLPDILVEISLPYLPVTNLYSMPPGDAIDLIRFHGAQYSNNDGYFNIVDQPISTLYLTIDEEEKNNYTRVLRIILSTDYSEQLIIMRKSCSLTGCVTDYSDNPIPDVEIWGLSFENGKTEYGSGCVFSNNDGIYIFNNIVEGNVYLHASHNKYGSEGQFVSLSPEKKNVCNFKLPDSISKLIIVQDIEGAFLENIHVHITDMNNGTVLFQGYTDSDGQCVVNSIIPSHPIKVITNSYFTNKQYSSSKLSFDAVDDSNIIVKLRKAFKFTVIVRDHNENDVDNFYAELFEGKSINYEDELAKNSQFLHSKEGEVSWYLYNKDPRLLVILSEYFTPYHEYIQYNNNNINDDIRYDVILKKGINVVGRIVDESTGNGIQKAFVRYSISSTKSNHTLYNTDYFNIAETDSDGFFEIANMPYNNFLLNISAFGYASKTIDNNLISSNGSDNIIILSKGSIIYGYLMNNNKIITSGIVEVYSSSGSFIKLANASINGYYKIDNLPHGNLTVKFYDHSMYSLYNNLYKHQIEIYLNKGDIIKLDLNVCGLSVVQGKCTFGGNITEGTIISLISAKLNSIMITAVTDFEGLYELRPVPEGNYIISAKSGIDGIGGEILKEVEVGKNEIVEVNFDFQSVTFEGNVKGSKGKEIYGCWITLIGSQQKNRFQGYTDIKGNYKFYNIPNDIYSISLVASGYASETDEIIISNNKYIKNYLLNPEGILKLCVKDTKGNKISTALAFVDNVELNDRSVISDSYGKFVFKNLNEGKVSVIAGAEGFAPNSITAGIVTGDTVEKDIILQKGGFLTFIAKDVNGQPINGAKVNFDYSGLFGCTWESLIKKGFIHANPANFMTSEKGLFEIGPLPTGTYTVHVASNGSYWSGEGKVSADRTTNITTILTDY